MSHTCVSIHGAANRALQILIGRADILHRKSDVRKKGKTRGWEIMLSHSFNDGITSGFVKGTPSSDVVRALEHLKACTAQAGHPMLLPLIVLSYDLSPINDQKQREARDWLRRLENAVSMREEVIEHERYSDEGLLEVDGLSRDLVECHGTVMWKRPQAYMALAIEMERAMAKFHEKWSVGLGALPKSEEIKTIDKLHRSMLARLDFYKVKLKGLQNYIHITLERLKVQREAVRPLHPSNIEYLKLTMLAVQHHVPERSTIESRNCRRAAKNRPCKQARQHRHENHLAHGCPLPAGNISCVGVQHDILQLPVGCVFVGFKY